MNGAEEGDLARHAAELAALRGHGVHARRRMMATEARAARSRLLLVRPPRFHAVAALLRLKHGRVTGDEGQVKPRGRRGHADLALYLGGFAGRAWLRGTPRLGAVLAYLERIRLGRGRHQCPGLLAWAAPTQSVLVGC